VPTNNGLAGADGFASRPPRPRDGATTTGSTRTTGSFGTTGPGGVGPGRHRAGAADPGPDEEDEAPATGTTGTGRRRAGGSGPGRTGKVGRNGKPKRKGSFWRELPLLIVVAIVLTFVIQTFLARIYVIPSASMERTLHGCSGCNNDRVAVDKISYRFSDPSPGDVVVFRGPPTWGDNGEVSNERSGNVLVRGLQTGLSLLGLAPPDEKDFVKRVIAVGGQTVACCDPQNRILVDGQPLTEPYLYFQPNLGRTQQDFAPVVVPPGQLWVMGDNRNNSADARVHGPISTTDVIGKARVIVLPVGRWGGVPDTDPQTRVAALGPSELGAPGWADGLAPVAGLVGAVPLVGLSRRLRRRALIRAGDRGTGEDPDADPHDSDLHGTDPPDRPGTRRTAPPDPTAR
jgi:signal peptidase I